MKCFIILILITFSLSNAYGQKVQFKHVEPANWWVNMEHSKVEVMLHGDNIAKYAVKAIGLEIVGIVKTENPNYLFVTLETKSEVPGTYPIQLFDRKKQVASYDFELKQRAVDSKMRRSFTPADMIYLLMPDRFSNGDPSNDQDASMIEKMDRKNPGGRHGGDIQGIINHLPYLKELGATAIWSTPLLCDNDTVFSYHTYGQSDIYKIDPRYGTNQDYQRLVKEAHALQLKIIMDVVPNHWGQTHWMMKDLPTYEWIHQFPGYGQTNYRMTTQIDPNAAAVDQKYCEEGWFVKSMPDINQSNPLALNYLIQNAIWWIEFAGIDGFRVDTYCYNNKEGIASWTKAITDEYPNFSITGEVWVHDQAQISYWQKDSPISKLQSYNSHLPMVMDFTLQDALTVAFNETEQKWDKGLYRIYDNLTMDFLYAEPNNTLIFAENHDTDRFNEYCPKLEDYKLLMTLLATMRGVPQLYAGSEIGMKGNKSLGDADIRKDFPGGWSTDSQNAFIEKGTKNVLSQEGRTDEQKAYFEITKLLFNWRKNKAVIHTGKTMQFIPEHNVYVYFRYNEAEKVMVVLNNSRSEEKIDLSRFSEIMGTVGEGKDVISGAKINLGQKTLAVPAKTSLILELK